MSEKEVKSFYPENSKAWRKWLKDNHTKEQSVWLICYKQKTGIPTLSWSEAVDEALCYGWIDSTRRSIDEEKYMQLFSKRKAKSTWSKINKEKVERLIAEGKMTTAGFRSIQIAKENGSWTILDTIEDLSIPNDMEKEFKAYKGSKEFFLSLSKSTRKSILQWILMAKQSETRQKRISEVAELASKKLKPKQF